MFHRQKYLFHSTNIEIIFEKQSNAKILHSPPLQKVNENATFLQKIC